MADESSIISHDTPYSLDNLRILTTVIEMLNDRKYVFPNKFPPVALLVDPSKIIKMPGMNNKVFDTTDLIRDDRGTPIFVHIMKDDESFSGSKHKEIVAKDISRALNPVFPDIKPANKELELITKFVHLILIFNHHRNPNKRYEVSKFEMEPFQNPNYNYEVWPKHRLRFNVTKHIYVGQHIKLTPEQADTYRNEFNLNNQNMQKICLDDPVNRYYYGQPDEIYRILRIQQGINYRIVARKMLASMKTK